MSIDADRREVNQYDLVHPEFVADPYPTMAEVRAECPVGRSTEHGGSWMSLSYQAAQDLAADVERLSSEGVLVLPPQPHQLIEPQPRHAQVTAPPITSDPPEHLPIRKLILPFLAPGAVKQYEPGTRELCNRLIDGFIDDGRADIATGYAQQIPVRIISALLGIDDSQSDRFVGWVRAILELGHLDHHKRAESRTEMLDYFQSQIEDRRSNPRAGDDLFTALCRITDDDGQPLPDYLILGIANLMLIAGIDTTWSSIGAGLWHLAQHPEQRQQLRDDPALWPRAIEELLRAYSPVSMGRIAVDEVDYEGCPIRPGDKVVLSFPAANRDPAVFDDPDVVDFERTGNRHVAFGSGIHRCAGSNLARLEMRVALQTFLERIPDFQLEDPGAVTWAGGQVRGPRVCFVTF